ncbi:unnamed protein product [Aureobasidium uvarum]|uniref:Uncharacterized protein n=1 Tax=Aureobasidium uvarum TaxID=2773716 RepID=A0A9N8PSC3_9PEZI|nr:unnamed protein product [Aureobasidium uvarum]
MCCKRRANRQVSTMAKLVQDQPMTASRTARNEPMGPPPAYEQIEKESKDISPSKNIHATEYRNNEYTAINTDLDSPSHNTTIHTVIPQYQSRCAAKHAAKRERKQLKREHRQENRMEKREYRNNKREFRQEKRELRAEHRFEEKQMRRAHGGPISLLIQGVSNLMKK